MGFLQAYRMAIKSITGNKARSFLTMLGVIIGVASVIAAVAFAQGSTKNVTNSIQGLGTNLIQVTITGRNSNRNLTLEQLQQFADKNSADISMIAPQVSGNVTVKYGTSNKSTSLIGTSPEYEDIRNVHVSSGRFINSFDVDGRQKVALVGGAIVNDIFNGDKPIGKTIKVEGSEFKIVGVLQEKSGGQDQSDDDVVIIPVTAAQRLMNSAIIRNFSIQAASADTVDSAMDKLNTFLATIYKNNTNKYTPYRVFNQAQLLSSLSNVTGSMMVILGGIAAISLIVGGIGIMNIMLVSVTERIREIGIRKALGAKRKSILIQFLIEAIIVTGIGGIIGVTLGLSIIHFVIGGLKIVPEVYSMAWTVVSFGISVIVGVIFGLFPAYKAANLDPIEALRTE